MKLLVCILLLVCFAEYGCAQRWTRRWFRRSSWFDNSWNTQPGLDNSWSWGTWNTQPTGWTTWDTQPVGWSTWNTQPAGWSTWDTQPTGWTGDRDSWYQWYSWYSWQGAPVAGAQTGVPLGGTAGLPTDNAPAGRPPAPPNAPAGISPTRPNAPAPDNRQGTSPTGPTRPRPRGGSRRSNTGTSRYKRDVGVANDIPPMTNGIVDLLTRDPRPSSGNPSGVKCPSTYRPVCGNNNRTYDNTCDLIKATFDDECLDFAYDGECVFNKEILCYDCMEEDFRISYTKNILTGFADWLAYNMVVCGTDGVTYDSMCHLCKRKCLDSSVELRPKHRGHCGAPFTFTGN